MTKSLDIKYTEIMTDKLLKIYYKSLFFKEHFDVHYILKNFKLNELFLSFLSRKLYNSIKKENLDLILSKYNINDVINNIKISIQEIFNLFNKQDFSSEEYFEDIKSICPTYNTEIGQYNIDFSSNKFKQELPFYIEKYIRVEDYDSPISEREGIYKNVVNIETFMNYIETDPLFLFMTNEQKKSAFKSIKYGIRVIYYQNNTIHSENINLLRQNNFYKQEKCWVLFGAENSSNNENSVVKFPLEICREESNNLLNVFRDDIFIKIKDEQIINDSIQELLNSLIINKDYKRFFTNIVPLQLINLMNYVEFKKISALFREIFDKNDIFTIDESIIKLIKEIINYKELVK